MGCDIHMICEQRGPDGVWRMVGEKTSSKYDGRNYNLFGMLANVRNGVGFAGCDTGDGFVPISMPRGLPPDASPEYREWVDEWGADGHSHSWLTLRELLDYDWDQTTKERGWVDAETFAAWDVAQQGGPSSWCGEVFGGRTRHVSIPEMRRRVREGMAQDCYTLLEWSTTYRDAAGSFYTETLPKLREIASADDVRIVFFFDN